MLAPSAISHSRRRTGAVAPSRLLGDEFVAAPASPARALLELAVTCLCAELHLWFLYSGPAAWRNLNFAVMAVVIASSCWRRRGRLLTRDAGAPWQAWGEALTVTIALSAVVATTSLACGLWADDLRIHSHSSGFPLWLFRKLLTVVTQQLLLFGLVYPLFVECFSAWSSAGSRDFQAKNLALGASALAFGALHLPNPLLMVLTFTAGVIWIGLYRRHGRILPLVASHLLLTLLVRETCYDAVYHMRVGADAWQLLPSTVATREGPLPLCPLSVQGALDALEPAGDKMVCAGWAADIDGGKPADAILVVYQGETHRFPSQRHGRPDVAQAFATPGICDSGFELQLPRSWFAAGEPPRFFAEIGPNGRAELWRTKR